MKTCIYHGKCTDGVAAAWAVWSADKNYHFFPGVYQQEPPWNLIDKDTEVLLVDFSYKRPVIEEIQSRSKSITILDHHPSARKDLEPLLADGSIKGVFDMNRCGALITWEYFHPTEKAPTLLEQIDAHDRWLDNRDLQLRMALKSYNHSPSDKTRPAFHNLMQEWSQLMKPSSVASLKEAGIHIHRYYRQRVEETKRYSRPIYLRGVEILIVNAPVYLASDVAGELATKAKNGIGAVWWQNTNRSVTISLRSRSEVDVSKIAVHFGGGGHKNAAGFKLDPEQASVLLF